MIFVAIWDFNYQRNMSAIKVEQLVPILMSSRQITSIYEQMPCTEIYE